ncbi:MAG: flagellin [Gammaproteobacteria bacterium]|nr:flagellin [Gammaproteobacteria bacterium]
MSIAVNTNVNSLLAQNYLTGNQAGLSQALNRLSSGLRINDAKDDAAGLAIAQGMQEFSNSYRQGSRNGNDGVSLIQTAQSAMTDSLNLLQRMRELASEGASGTYSTSDLTNLNTEFTALNNEINRVASNTTFNGISLLNNATGSLSIQVGTGNTANDRLTITLANGTTGSAGLNTASANVSTNAGAQTALTTLDTAIKKVTTSLAQLGANEANLEAAVNGNDAVATDLESAKSRIMDADFASESGNLAKFNILNQANVAMLSQANSSPQMVLQLLKG